MECSVCIEKYNRSSRSVITCPSCNYTTCSSCTEKYLLSSLEESHCMSCRVVWTNKMMSECGLSKTFQQKEYKNHVKTILFERERSMMPETQPYVEIAKKKHEIALKIEASKTSIKELTILYHETYRITLDQFAEIHGCANETEALINKMETLLDLSCAIQRFKASQKWYKDLISRLSDINPTRKETRKYIRSCPFEGCSGFLNHRWHCTLCDHWTCQHCLEVKTDDHVCDPNSVETAKMLKADSKSCPKCAAMIFKIDGCDQMFCTQCTTVFSWKHGTIEKGRIHNPHYFEYMKKNGTLPRAIGDIPCGGMPSDADIQRVTCTNDDMRKLLNISRLYYHILNYTIPRYEPTAIDNKDLRISFMLNNITEDHMKTKLYSYEKQRRKNADVQNILNTYVLVSAEIMQRIVHENRYEHIEEIYHLREWINTLLADVSKLYTLTVPRIGDYVN